MRTTPSPVLCRGEIIRAVRIRKLLDQAAATRGTPEAVAYLAKALDLARSYPRGVALVYNGEPVLADHDVWGADGH